jgi:hypothetical protein
VLIYAGLGNRDRVFEVLREPDEADDVMADIYPAEPELAFLRGNARMTDFCRN